MSSLNLEENHGVVTLFYGSTPLLRLCCDRDKIGPHIWSASKAWTMVKVKAVS
jgi:hypothetical protein